MARCGGPCRAQQGLEDRSAGALHGTPEGADLPHPFDGLDLLRFDGTKVVASLERLGSQLKAEEGVPVALCGIDVDPGIYLLRHRLAAGRRFAQTVVAVAGWQTTVTFRRSADDTTVEKGKARFRRPGVLGVLMRLLGGTGAAQPAAIGWSQAGAYDEDQLVETARQALADGTNLLEAI